jgi:short-subunit dehydrogenase
MGRRLDASTVVVIVGASSGIGRAAALRFARHGSCLVLAARSRSSLAEVAQACGDLGAEAGVVVADITRPGEVERIADEALSRFGRIDVWVAAASVYGYGEIDRMPADEARAIIDTNLHGTIDQVRAALPALRRSGGVVVIVGSVFSSLASPYVWAYVASKHAVAGFAASVRQELRRGPHPVEVAMIWPATTDTPIYQHAANRTGRRIHPIPPVVDPDRVARAIVRAAERPRRRRVVGVVQGSFLALHAVAPSAADRVLAVTMNRLGLRRRPTLPTSGTVDAPDPGSNAVSGGWRER